MTTKQIQYLLAYLGYDLQPDGIPGPQTGAAVKEFQGNFGGITVDGDPGKETQKALRHAVAYDLFRPEQEETGEIATPSCGTVRNDSAGTFWDEIRYFTRQEFACKCGGKYCSGFPAEPREDLVRLAEAAREHFGKPVTVVSGLRCPQWNTIQGGVADSQHQYGEACDVYVQGTPGATVLSWFLQQPGVRYAYQITGSQNVHFDVPKGDR